MEKYDYYILDFDGTLIDSFDGLRIFYREAFAPFGIEINDQDCKEFMKISLQEAFDRRIGKPEEIDRFAEICYGIVATDKLLKHNHPFEDALSFINYINSNHLNTAIVTGNSNHHVHKVLDYNHIHHFTNTIICSEDLTRQKPDPEGILLAVEKASLDINNNKICYVGDSWNDYLAAKKAGVTAILVDRDNEYPESEEYIRINKLTDLFD